MKNRKKMAAALSGVLAYIKTQEEALLVQSAASTQVSGQIPSGAEIPSIPMKLWGISGRQSQMQMRHHMLLKAFHRKV
jgi:hypothetical protein